MAAPVEDEQLELSRVSKLSVAYRDASKSAIRSRVNFVLRENDISKAKFAKLLQFQRTRVSMVLHNSYQAEAVVVYAKFAQWLAAQDARLVWSVIAAIEDEPESELFGLLRDSPVDSYLNSLTATGRAVALIETLGLKSNISTLDRLAKGLRDALIAHPDITAAATLPPLAVIRSYLLCTLSFPARSDMDKFVFILLSSKKPPERGWLHQQQLGIAGANRELIIPTKRIIKRAKIGSDDEEEEQPPPLRPPPAPRVETPPISEEDETDESDANSIASTPPRKRAHATPSLPSSGEGKQERSSQPAAATEPHQKPSTDGKVRSKQLEKSPAASPPAASSVGKSRPKQPNQWTYRNPDGTVKKHVADLPSPPPMSKKRAATAPYELHPPPSSGSTTKKRRRAQESDGSSVTSDDNDDEYRDANTGRRHMTRRSGHVTTGPTTVTSSLLPRRPYQPRDNGQQQGPYSGFSLDAYTPPVFLKTSMKMVLKRVSQVLTRDGISRRQVALQIGISQSKISRLLHGRSPFRTADEEFHMRHWVYQRERLWVEKLNSVIRRSIDENGIVDFSSLPAPLQAIQPPQQLILYLHYLLDLNLRGAIDRVAAKVMGIDSDSWIAEAEEGEAEQAENAVIAAAEDAREKEAEQKAMEVLTPQLERMQSDESKVGAPLSPSPPVASPSPEPAGPFTGVDAWQRASNTVVRLRLNSLVQSTYTAQTTLAPGLGLSSATVSMILRGVFRFASLNSYLAKLRRWGELSDRLIVAKCISALGADHQSIDLPFRAKDDATERALLMRTIQPVPADTDYAAMLGHDDAEILDAEAEEAATEEGAQKPAAALRELVDLLAEAEIPLESDESDMKVDDGGTADKILPLSLWSWLQFRCDFSERPHLDRIMVPWIERWSGVDAESSGTLAIYRDLVSTADRFEKFLQEEFHGLTDPKPYRSNREVEKDAIQTEEITPKSDEANPHGESQTPIQPSIKNEDIAHDENKMSDE